MPNANLTSVVKHVDQSSNMSEKFLTIPYYGDSMYPAFQSGDVIFCKLIDHKNDLIPFGESFLIITDDFKAVKYLRQGPEEGIYTLVSENSEKFSPLDIPINIIQRLYIITGVVRRTSI